jgi:L-seryl-tRNA(Ser) seleniumtransferase
MIRRPMIRPRTIRPRHDCTVTDPRRSIPSVDRLLASAPFARVLELYPRELVVATVQSETERVRSAPTVPDREGVADPAWYADRVGRALSQLSSGSLHPAINATGVVLHTNLGRAPLAAAALEAIARVAGGYSTLEYDIGSGRRGSRYAHSRDLLVRLTGAEDALVVNNNAAALVLALNTTSRGMDAIISRGELVEIGGSFRVPEIMERSGARLREVGSTNRTHADDYRAAISAQTGALLKVHPSNFTIQGFTAEVGGAELAGIAEKARVPFIHDIGSGLLIDGVVLGLGPEPHARDAIRAGAHVITMSGDKLLGGPQCGIIAGSAQLVQRMRENPLCRAFRVDKLTLAALGATLRLYLEPDRALREIPVLRMLAMPLPVLEARSAAFAVQCSEAGLSVTPMPGTSAVGGGAAPAAVLPTVLLRIGGMPAAALERKLRHAEPPVVCRVVDDAVVLDLRTVAPEDDGVLLGAVRSAVHGAGS